MRCLVIAGTIALLLQINGCATDPPGAPESTAGARTVKYLFSNAEGHFFKGNLAEAIAGYSGVIAADPKNAQAFRGRAAAYAALGRESEALADYGRAVEIDPRFDDAWLGRGLYHFSRGRYAEAVDDLGIAAELDPRNPVVHKYRALACDKVGRLRDAALSRQAYVHCEALPEPPTAVGDAPPARELKALALE